MNAKQNLIEQLARFLTDDVGGKSVLFQMEMMRPEGDPRPALAKEWVALRRTAQVDGYADQAEAVETLTKILK